MIRQSGNTECYRAVLLPLFQQIVIPNYNVDGESERARVIRELREYGLSEDEVNLYYLDKWVQGESLGLSKLSFSKISYSKAVRAHVKDSWLHTKTSAWWKRDSGQSSHPITVITGGAYTRIMNMQEIMWDKPSELDRPHGSRYEISVYHRRNRSCCSLIYGRVLRS